MSFSQIDAVWLVVASALVILVQAGFAVREAGLVRSRNSLNAATKAVGGLLGSVLVFWLCGWAFGFGAGSGSTAAWLGTSDFLLGGDRPAATLAFFVYQAAIAGVVCAIVSGAVAERLRAVPFLVLALFIAGFVYPVAARWGLWNGGPESGWLAGRGFVDRGGATVLHTLAGWSALAGVLAIGARGGRFTEEGPRRIPGSQTALAATGTLLVLAGWLGLSGGAHAASPAVATTVLLGGAAGGVTGLLLGVVLRRRVEVELTLNGLLAGLVAVSGAPDAFTLPAAVIIGAVGAGVMVAVDAALTRLRIDDAVGAIPVHLGAGLWGTLAVGLFASGGARLGTNLDRGMQLKAQLEGLLAIGIWGFGISFVLFKIVGVVAKLRLAPEDEQTGGLNAADHQAQSDVDELVETMDQQASTGDMKLRAHVEAFTDVGRISRQYNRVLETLEFTTAQNDSLVRTSLDGLITFNTEGIITSSNPASSAIFGYSEREFRTVSVTSLFAPSRDKTKGRADLQTLLANFVGRMQEVRGQRRSGEDFIMEAAFNYVSVGEDEIYTATFRDITQRKETEAELARTQAEIRRRLEQELEDAKVVQNALLPATDHFPHCEIAKHYQAATETGGDWFGYYFFPEQQSITFYMGDVTGHGLPSALMSGVVCGAVYAAEFTHGLLDPRHSAERQLRNIADVVNRIVLQTGKGELLMTMAFLHVNLRTGHISFLNAGHNMPFLVKGGQTVQSLVSRGSRLGESNKPEFEIVHAKLDPSDVIVLYTDGLLENQGPDGKQLSVREFKSVLTSKSTATEICDELVSRAKAVWQGGAVADDHSILVFRWTPQAQPLRARTLQGPGV